MADNHTEKQKVQELTDKLERGLTELFNSDSYKNYLSTMSKFHNYSFNNTLLITMHCVIFLEYIVFGLVQLAS